MNQGNENRTVRESPGGPAVEKPPAMQGTRVGSLVWEEPTCHGAVKPGHQSWGSAMREATPVSSLRPATREQPLLAAIRGRLCTAAKTQHSQK